MSQSALYSYIEAAITSLVGVKGATQHQKPPGWDVAGWIYNPPSLSFKGGLGGYMFSSENTNPDFYFISDPTVGSDGSGYQVSFLFGHLKDEFQSSGMDLYLSIVMHFDSTGTPLNAGHITAYEAESGGAFGSFPLPHGAPFLPETIVPGVDTVLVVIAYAQELNDWLTKQGYNNIYGAQEGLAAFGAIVLNQVAFGVKCAVDDMPKSAVAYTAELARPFLDAARSWSDVDWESGSTEHGAVYFEKTYNAQTVRFWWPTFVTQATTWECVIKFDMIRSGGKDDHAFVCLAGTFDRDAAVYGEPCRFSGSFGLVLSITATSNYQHSGGENLSVTQEQPEGVSAPEDVLSAWASLWTEENETEPPAVVNFADGVKDLVAKFVAQLRTVSSAPMAGTWDVSAQGRDTTSLFVTARGGVLAGCCGEVFILDPQSQVGHVLAKRVLPNAGANEIAFTAMNDTGFVGCNGYVYAVSLTDLSDAFGGKGTAADYSLTQQAGHGTTRLTVGDDRLFAGCNGWVFELDPLSAAVLWSYNLNTLTSSMEQSGVCLSFYNNKLYAATNGLVARLDVAATQSSPCTGPASTSTYYNLPSCGHHYTTLARTHAGDVFAACNGYVFKLDPASTNVLWTTRLGAVDSGFGNHTTYICLVSSDTTLLAGSNDRVARLSCSDGEATPDVYKNKCYDVNAGGQGSVHVLDDGEGGLAACNGYVFRLNATHYNMVDGPPTGSATLQYNMNLDDRAAVHLEFIGGVIFAGMNGTVQALPWKPFNYA